ncbi:sugar porter family MFS transporter [Luteolibacter arcticus]|uniref:Sugar porter family MFS transporter n=1 Tax=Luteolibacter arcticus TaxID=1581411 RepID=A0ABT3GI30_9BACT|nr:sugar porter family MFS transporter [Luteolibacter arcticus]MCW1923154.1 sugar porter family MFS transporter [Luteolibacter arcticus]
MQNKTYTFLLVAIASLGGLLYGYDLGIISSALLYLDKCVRLSEAEVGMLASAIMIGALASSVIGGGLSDLIGRKKTMILAAFLFVASVGIIVLSAGFWMLFAGRTLQGLSAGMIAVVVPVFMSECAPAKVRGISSTMFQLCITLGIAVAMAAGAWYQSGVDDAVQAAAGDAAKILSAQDHAWRQMFLSSAWPAVVFVVAAFVVPESPRWLFRHGQADKALAVLLKGRDAAQARLELREMEELAATAHTAKAGGSDQILQKRYLWPLALAITLLAINQATGICAVFTFPVVMLNQAGLSEGAAAHTGVWLAVANFVTTIFGVLLVDRLGRKWLLKIGTAIMLVALGTGVITYWKVEAGRTDVTAPLTQQIEEHALVIPVKEIAASDAPVVQVSVQYTRGGKEQPLLLLRSDAKDPVLALKPDAAHPDAKLEILRAKFSPAPSETTGQIIFACLILYIVGFAFGPGVCLWLMSSELLPTRVRSIGMGLGVLGNAGVTILTTWLFLPIIGNFGYAAMWGVWFVCTFVYFLFAAFILPETKGKTLEEIEAYFAK